MDGEHCPQPYATSGLPRRPRIFQSLVRACLIALIGALGCVARPAQAQSVCGSCEVLVGVGGTYHYWGATGGVVVPVTVSWSQNRYELGFFRVTTQQLLAYRGPYARVVAQPYGGMSLSRRWQVYETGPVKAFFGFGLAGKSESDILSVTRWDFASQFGVRFPLPGDNRVIGELTMRHWSNAGIRLPNHGQDFVTFTMRVDTGLPGFPRTDQISIDPHFSRESARLAHAYGSEQELLP